MFKVGDFVRYIEPIRMDKNEDCGGVYIVAKVGRVVLGSVDYYIWVINAITMEPISLLGCVARYFEHV